MRFRIEFLYIDPWDARYDGHRSWTSGDVRGPNEAIREFHDTFGTKNVIQYIVREADVPDNNRNVSLADQ